MNFLPRSVLLCFPTGESSPLATSTHLIIQDRNRGTRLGALSSFSLLPDLLQELEPARWGHHVRVAPWEGTSPCFPVVTQRGGERFCQEFAASKTGLSAEAEAQHNDENCKRGWGLVAGRFATKIVQGMKSRLRRVDHT